MINILRRSSKFATLKVFFTTILLTLAMGNVLALDSNTTEAIDKEAYLDLSQEYTPNQVVIEQDNSFTSFFKDIYVGFLSTLVGTKSSNVDQLPNKISNNLANTAIGKTESFINKQANTVASSFGSGKTFVSLQNIESEKPSYSVDTIQPLSALDSNSKSLTFIQGSVSSGFNEGERRHTLNVGLGKRYLLDEDQAIVGANLFFDIENTSKHKRVSLGAEYERSNYSAGVNYYHPISDKKVIGDYTEEVLKGYDVSLSGQMPYMPWVTMNGTHYYWDQTVGNNIMGNAIWVGIELSPSMNVELGQQDSNTSESSSFAKLIVKLPVDENEQFTKFEFDSTPFRSSAIIDLASLKMVKRSKKIQIEKLLNGVSVTLGVYNATTVGASCALKTSAGVVIETESAVTDATGMVTFNNVVLPTGIIVIECIGGQYTDEATGSTVSTAPTLHLATNYAGGNTDLTVYPTPLSEIAYQLANTDSNLSDIATKSTQVADLFGLDGIDIIAIKPTDLNNGAAAADSAGMVGLVLAAISQMGTTDSTTPTATITALTNEISTSSVLTTNKVSNAVRTLKASGLGASTNAGLSTDAENLIQDNTAATKAVAISVSSISVTESGTVTYTITLDAKPSASVTIKPASSNTSAITVSSALTFTSANWFTAQTVTLTGVVDANSTNESVTISHSASSADSTYNAISINNTTATQVDDVNIGITQSKTSMTVGEAGTNTYTVVLDSEPSANVTITPSSSNTSAATVSGALTFTTSNWATAQTITVSGVSDGNNINESVTISHTVSGGDYASVTVTDVAVTTADDYTAGITLSAISGNTTEGTATATFTIVLNTEPTADVVIALSSSDTTEGTVSPSSVTFTNSNWSSTQTVTVTGVNDDIDDGDINYSIVTAAATSSDSDYSGLNASDASVTNTDNDTAGVTLSSISGNTTEGAATATFTIVLNTEPTADVVIALSSSDTTEGTVSPSSVTFTSSNWSSTQTVTVTGVNDDIDDDNISYSIVTAAATSSDPDYSGLNASDVSITNTDNDTAGITQSATSATIGEASTYTYTIVLDTEPTADVVIALSSSDTSAATVTSSLTFTNSNWSSAQTVTITGVDDVDLDNETVTINHSISGGGYGSITMTNFTATMTDDDSISLGGLDYGTVTSLDTGRVWLDRNLGATKICESSTDSSCFGNFYQWGRNDDGHESGSSSSGLNTSITPADSTRSFGSSQPYDWTTADASGSLREVEWADGGDNDICPAGFSVPTVAELKADTIDASTTEVINAASALSSFLKLPAPGVRMYRSPGGLADWGGYYWSSDSYVSGIYKMAKVVRFADDQWGGFSQAFQTYRAYSFSVRCIKDL